MRVAVALAALLLAACGGGSSGPGDGSMLPVLYEGHPLAHPWTDQHGYSVTFESTGLIVELTMVDGQSSGSTLTECRGATWTPSSMGTTGEVTFDYGAERCVRSYFGPGGGSATRRESVPSMRSGSERVTYAITPCGGDPFTRTCAVRLVAGRFVNLEG